MEIKEYLLSTDNFKNPKILSGEYAMGTLLIRLLLLVPGTNPLHPGMGVGLGTKLRYISEEDKSYLDQLIEDQIRTYMPPIFMNVNVQTEFTDDEYLIVRMQIDDTEYIYDTSETDNPVTLSELINQ